MRPSPRPQHLGLRNLGRRKHQHQDCQVFDADQKGSQTPPANRLRKSQTPTEPASVSLGRPRGSGRVGLGGSGVEGPHTQRGRSTGGPWDGAQIWVLAPRSRILSSAPQFFFWVGSSLSSVRVLLGIPYWVGSPGPARAVKESAQISGLHGVNVAGLSALLTGFQWGYPDRTTQAMFSAVADGLLVS